MDWEKKYTEVTLQVAELMGQLGFINVQFKPATQVENLELTCRRLHKLAARLVLLLD